MHTCMHTYIINSSPFSLTWTMQRPAFSVVGHPPEITFLSTSHLSPTLDAVFSFTGA